MIHTRTIRIAHNTIHIHYNTIHITLIYLKWLFNTRSVIAQTFVMCEKSLTIDESFSHFAALTSSESLFLYDVTCAPTVDVVPTFHI